jgi:hypothetical protein
MKKRQIIFGYSFIISIVFFIVGGIVFIFKLNVANVEIFLFAALIVFVSISVRPHPEDRKNFGSFHLKRKSFKLNKNIEKGDGHNS